MTPIATATNMPGPPIQVRGEPYAIAVTPDGKTVYVANTFGTTPLAIAVTPKGEAAYAPRRARSLMKGAAGLPLMSAYEWFSITTTTVCAGSGTAAA